MAERRQTALGVARARFVEGLPRKAREVKASVALLAGTPDEERPREELRRRLHALYASAQVFRLETLADAIKSVLTLIDRVREERRGFAQEDLDRLANLAATLPKLGEAEGESVSAEESAPPSDGQREVAPKKKKGPPPPPAGTSSRKPPRAPAAPVRKRSVDAVVTVLVLDDPEWQAQARAALAAERFEVITATEAQEALRLARTAAPDVVVADRALAERGELIARLREDPLTDFVPVVLLMSPGNRDMVTARQAGADDALPKPFEPDALAQAIRRLTDSGPAGASTLVGDLTVEQIADRIAEEVKRGLVEATEQGGDLRVPLGDGSPLMAAAWSAIGRVRAHLAERSGGRVRFRETPRRGGPAFVTLVDEETFEVDASTEFSLEGRRAMVVDDDPAVAWFFAGLLREHGADVDEVSDGVEALERCRVHRPDVILSDILMPRLDGFGLTRALKRDPALSEIPIILLSWKEDFLQRMRQLKSGASGYLRKEAGSGQILARVRDALRPRVRLESRLKAGGDVRGRLEDVGIQTLLTTVASLRPNARLTIRDAASLYEVDIRGGELYDVTRTASDGTFARGDHVLLSLLGATAGRYTIADSEMPIRRSIEASMADAIAAGMKTIAARIASVSGKALGRINRITFEEDTLAPILASSPDPVAQIIERLRQGTSPRELLTSGDAEPLVLEEVLVDLARQGALANVEVAQAPAPTLEFENEALEVHEEGSLSWLKTKETTEQILLSAGLIPLRIEPPESLVLEDLTDEAPELAVADLDEPFGDESSLANSVLDDEDASADEPELRFEAESLDSGEHEDEQFDEEHFDAGVPDLTAEEAAEHVQGLDDLEPPAHAHVEKPRASVPPKPEPSELPEPSAAEPQPAPPEPPPPEPALGIDPAPLAIDSPRPEAVTDPSPPPTVADAPQSLRIPPSPKLVPAPKPAAVPAAAAPRSTQSGLSLVAWVLAFAALVAVGFVGWRWLHPTPAVPQPEPVPPSEPTVARPPHPQAPHPEVPHPEAPTGPQTPEPPLPPQQAGLLPPAYGRDAAGIADLGVQVPAQEGLLVLEPGAAPMRVRVDDRQIDLGAQPVGMSLAAGVHHVAFAASDRESYVFVAVVAGRTRYVPPPP